MPRRATAEQRIAWHLAHQQACACRPIPGKLQAQLKTAAAPPVDPRFAPVADAFAAEPRVTTGGKGFGSSGLKVDGKLFAMLSSKGLFVAKLPRKRVDELVRLGKGERFDPGHGRLMREWVAVDGAPRTWVALAREAHRFVAGDGT
jgi:hypothetical protein